MHCISLNKLTSFLVLCSVIACSSAKTEKALTVSKVSPSQEDQTQPQGLTHSSSDRLIGTRPKLESCIDDEGLVQVWHKKTLAWQACSFPTQLYQCSGTLGTDGDGSITRWTLIKVHQDLNRSKSASTTELQAHVLWTSVISSEEIPSAHAERIYSKTKLIPNKAQTLGNKSCRSFTAQRIQKARSFNLVDARESEFDESNIDESIFEYDQNLQQYKSVDPQEEDFEIKVRSH